MSSTDRPWPRRARSAGQRVKSEWISLRDAAAVPGGAVREAAKIYAVSTYTLRRRISSGDIPAVTLGYKLIRMRIEDLDKLFPAIPSDRPEDRYRRW